MIFVVRKSYCTFYIFRKPAFSSLVEESCFDNGSLLPNSKKSPISLDFSRVENNGTCFGMKGPKSKKVRLKPGVFLRNVKILAKNVQILLICNKQGQITAS